MSIDVSGFGTKITILASRTYPFGITLTQFPADQNPIDVTPMTIGEAKMGVNGDLIVNRAPAVVSVALNIVPRSKDDQKLAILLKANFVGKNAPVAAADQITMTVVEPTGNFTTYYKGILITGVAGSGLAQSGAKITKPYTFLFESYDDVPGPNSITLGFSTTINF